MKNAKLYHLEFWVGEWKLDAINDKLFDDHAIMLWSFYIHQESFSCITTV